MIDIDNVTLIDDEKFIKMYELVHDGDRRYVAASRRNKEDLLCVQPDELAGTQLPDAVSCFVILRVKGTQPRLLLSWEYRYPAGQYLLSVPAGLIDPEDFQRADPLEYTTIREIKEETGIEVLPGDTIEVVNPFVWSTPGFTDECNALMGVTLNRESEPALSQTGAEGMEMFDGFCLLTKEEARNIITAGRDPRGGYLPLFTWAALMYFIAQE